MAHVIQDPSIPMPNAATNIHTLSPDLQSMIVAHLNPAESTLLGLTCKNFYGLHWQKHGKVGLDSRETRRTMITWDSYDGIQRQRSSRLSLGELLEDWSGLYFNPKACKKTGVWKFLDADTLIEKIEKLADDEEEEKADAYRRLRNQERENEEQRAEVDDLQIENRLLKGDNIRKDGRIAALEAEIAKIKGQYNDLQAHYMRAV